MKKIIILNKEEGKTPLEVLEDFRSKNTEYENISMTYAGRLDPMASGLLLMLAGDEVKNKNQYLILKKEYKFEVLFGFTTDTYDILGRTTSSLHDKNLHDAEIKKNIKEVLKDFIGEMVQEYPIYSSKTVKGKSLFEYARNNENVVLPKRKIFIESLKLLKIRSINKKLLLENIKDRIKKVKGDFRQKEIIEDWDKFINHSSQNEYLIASFTINCSSGTYVRSIANNLGKRINIPALAFSIKRTKIDTFSLEDCV